MVERHVVVSGGEGVFCGWPANNGGWCWGDEVLIGFLRGKYGRAHLHNVVGKLELVHARSNDGGETWVEEPTDIDLDSISPTAPPRFSLRDSILHVCGEYDHGGDNCPQSGAFFLSQDRGHTWAGPYLFAGLEGDFSGEFSNTSRAAVLGDVVFLSAKETRVWGSDWAVVARHDGERFHKIGEILAEGRVVMPAPIKTVDGRFVVAARRRGPGSRGGWIDAFESKDGGASWRFLSLVTKTGGHNGNPPSLVELRDGRLVCGYANRTEKRICVRVSSDGGRSWGDPIQIRESKNSDIGYTRLFERPDGRLLICYYFSSDEMPHQHIAVTIFTV